MRGWDVQWSNQSIKLGYRSLVTIPSYVQHIGIKGMHTANGMCDLADDFIDDLSLNQNY
jgi:hypothetical protein